MFQKRRTVMVLAAFGLFMHYSVYGVVTGVEGLDSLLKQHNGGSDLSKSQEVGKSIEASNEQGKVPIKGFYLEINNLSLA